MPRNDANVDERIVEMRIDNRQFIDGAEKTISILDRLKSSLSFKDVSESTGDFNKIASSIESIADRFTTMGLIGQSVIRNLTDSVTSFVTGTVKNLTVDPVTGGFDKYESILRSTQTIMSATMNEKVPERFGSQLEYVGDQINQLSWFTDETSYSLQDMVSNIGKFTSAGVKLESSVTYMQGIANWGASAGASVAEVSRAMYNLSQAMSVGVVKLQDWRSIENANMATLEFKQTVIDAAVELGKLKKIQDGVYQTTSGKKTTVTTTNFNETLQQGWFSSGVLESALQKYGKFSSRLGAVMEDVGFSDAGFSTSEIIDWVDAIKSGDKTIEDWRNEISESFDDDTLPSIEQLSYAFELLSDDELELSKRAFLMGQQYRTFGDVISATKDAVSTGWMKTFELIIGNAEQATKVWTAVGEVFYELFAEGASRRNAILKWWAEAEDGVKSGRESFLDAISGIYKAVRSFVDPIVNAFDKIFSWGPAKEAGEKLRKITYAFEKFVNKLELSKTAQAGMEVFFTNIFNGVKKILGVFKPLSKAFGTAILYVKRFAELFFISFSSGKFNKDYFLAGLKNLFRDIGISIGDAWESLKKFIDSLKDIPVVGTVVKIIKGVFSLIEGAFKTISGLVSGKSIFDVIREKVSAIWNFISPIFGWLQEQFQLLKEKVSQVFSGEGFGISKILAVFAGLAALRGGKGLFDWIKFDVGLVTKPLQSILEFFGDLDDAVYGFVNETRIKAIKQLAISLLILAAALVVLSLVDSDKLTVSLVALAGGLVELVGTLAVLKYVKPKAFIQISSLLISLAVSMLIFSAALLVLSKIDTDSLVNALGAAFFMLAMVFAFVAAVSLLKVKPRTVSGIISLSIAMLIFTGVIYILGSIPYDKLEQGLIALAFALAIVSAAMLVLSSVGGVKMLAAGAGMIFLATAILILVGALALLTLIDFNKATNSLLILAGALLIVAAAALIMPAKLPLIGVGLVIVAAAIVLITAALIALSYVDVDKLANSLMIMGIALIGLAAIMVALTAAIPGAIALLIASVAFVVVSAALIVLGGALKILSTLPLSSLAGGIALVGAGLIALAIGLLAMTVGLVGAFVLVVAAAGIVILAAALRLMVGLDLPGIAGGLTLLGLAFIPLGIGGLILGLGAVGIAAGAVAMGLMALAMVPFVESLEKLQTIDFLTMVEYLMLIGGTAAVLAALTPVLGPLAIAVGAFGVACLAAGEGINLAGDGLVKITSSITSLPDDLGRTFKNAAKEIADCVTDFADAGTDIVSEIQGIGYRMQVQVESSSSLVKQSLIAAIQDAMLTVSALLQEDFVLNPVIKPVVDMTDVEEKSKTVNDMFTNRGGFGSVGKAGAYIGDRVGNASQNIQNITENKNTYSNDSYVINVYAPEGADPDTVANLVIDKLIRKGASLG